MLYKNYNLCINVWLKETSTGNHCSCNQIIIGLSCRFCLQHPSTNSGTNCLGVGVKTKISYPVRYRSKDYSVIYMGDHGPNHSFEWDFPLETKHFGVPPFMLEFGPVTTCRVLSGNMLRSPFFDAK